MGGGGDQTGKEGFFPFNLHSSILLFQGTLCTFFCCCFGLYFNSANEHPNDLQFVEENKIIYVLKKICVRVQNLISLRRERYFSIDSDY